MTKPAGAVLACALVLGTTACAGDDPVPVAAGDVIPASSTAPVAGEPVYVMLPSGRAAVTVSEPTDEVPAAATSDGRELAAADGTVLVGVSWSLDRGAYPDNINLQVVSPDDVFGQPAPVAMRLVADGTPYDVPDVGTLAEPVDERTGTAAWVAVPEGAETWELEVEYDGLTQTVDLGTGDIAPSAADPLYRDLPGESTRACDISGAYFASCLVYSGVGYPYSSTAGWAAEGRSFAVVSVSLGEDTPTDLTLAGGRPVQQLAEQTFTTVVFSVSSGRTLALRGRTTRPSGASADIRGTVAPGKERP